MTIAAPAPELRDVPARALRFAADFEIGKPTAGGAYPVTVKARSGEAVSHWFWGNVVHDLAGMRVSKPSIPFDYCHDDRDVMGFADKQDVSTGALILTGALVPYDKNPNDRAAEVLYKSGQGVPYEASIFFDDPVVIEEVAPGATSQANGKTFPGPVTIFRQWTLRGCAICPYGVDPNTAAINGFSDDRKVAATIQRKGFSMPAPAAPVTPPAAPPVAPVKPIVETPVVPPVVPVEPVVETPPVVPPVEPIVETPVVPPVAGALKTGADFLKQFGAQGGVWFAEGKSYDDCVGLFSQAQTARIAELETERDDLRKKLGLARGEKTPLSFSSGDADPNGGKPKPAGNKPKTGAGLSDGVSRFAENIKLPGKK